MKKQIGIIFLFLTLGIHGILAQAVSLKTKSLAVDIDANGYYSAITIEGKEVLKTEKSPLLIGLVGGKAILPQKLSVVGNNLQLTMQDKETIGLKYTQSDLSIVFEIESISNKYEGIVYGPIQLNINEVVGDVIGVVQGDGVSFGVQGLDIKTTAGIPLEYYEQVFALFTNKGAVADLSVESIPSYRLAAANTGVGSMIHLSVQRRNKQEYKQVEQLKSAMVLPVEGPDALIKGSRIALFGCKSSETLAHIGKLELEQGLPHPMVNGEWQKTARESMNSYLISNFGEDDLDFVLDKAKIANLKNIYHSGPFETWGHFNWMKSFVKDGSDASVKKMVDKAKLQNVAIGVHTLSNFMTTNDPYVTPIPSKQLLKQGILTLINDLDKDQTEITIKKSTLFDVPMSLNGLQIEDELITFGNIETDGDIIKLKNCTRGAFKTMATAHSKNQTLYKLWDYPYKTFFPDLKLQDQFADRISELLNNTGVAQISFDGLEGCRYTGHGEYAMARFMDRTYKAWDHYVLNDASRLEHYMWHIHTRMNWGEPWGEEMRKGQVENRIKNQAFFKRNLFPRMLGWFLVRLQEGNFECTSLEDLEWALSESAGFDAGYALVINMRTLKGHGQIDRILETVQMWDELRFADVFTDKQKEKLKDPETEWKLEKKDKNTFHLYPLSISKHFKCNLSEMQPGQPGGADWSWNTPYGGHFALRLRVQGDGVIRNPSFSTSKGIIKFPCEIKSGQYLIFDFEGKASVVDKNYNHIQDVTPQGIAQLPAGSVAVAFSCEHDGNETPEVDVRHMTRGQYEVINMSHTK